MKFRDFVCFQNSNIAIKPVSIMIGARFILAAGANLFWEENARDICSKELNDWIVLGAFENCIVARKSFLRIFENSRCFSVLSGTSLCHKFDAHKSNFRKINKCSGCKDMKLCDLGLKSMDRSGALSIAVFEKQA